MSPVQTAYQATLDAAFEGQKTDLGMVDIISKLAEGGDIDFGRAVVRGTDDGSAILPSVTGEDFLGVTEYTTAWAANASDIHLYQQYREMNIVRVGRIWVWTEQAVVPGDPAFFRYAAGAGGTVIGRFRKDVDTASADAIPGATFESTAGAGSLAILQLTGQR